MRFGEHAVAGKGAARHQLWRVGTLERRRVGAQLSQCRGTRGHWQADRLQRHAVIAGVGQRERAERRQTLKTGGHEAAGIDIERAARQPGQHRRPGCRAACGAHHATAALRLGEQRALRAGEPAQRRIGRRVGQARAATRGLQRQRALARALRQRRRELQQPVGRLGGEVLRVHPEQGLQREPRAAEQAVGLEDAADLLPAPLHERFLVAALDLGAEPGRGARARVEVELAQPRRQVVGDRVLARGHAP